MKKPMIITALMMFCLLFGLGTLPAQAIPTQLTVRARANDAKFIGTAVGGLDVVIKNYDTGLVLANGKITGGTGDTKILMGEPFTRGKTISTPGAAGYTATLDIDQPIKLLVEMIGPMSAGNDIHKESKTVWLLPGQDITGDGLIFNLYGLIVAPYTPAPHEFHQVGDTIRVAAHITPMCGCPIRPGMLWEAADYTVKATVIKGGKKIVDLPLAFAGEIGDFAADFIADSPGEYQFVITAADKRSNSGAALRVAVVIPAEKYRQLTGK